MNAKLHPSAALLAVDAQNRFCAGGTLTVAEGDRVIPLVSDCSGAEAQA